MTTNIKINKAAARKLFANRIPFWIVARNLRPTCGILIGSPSCPFDDDRTFDQIVNAYEYYNCNNETGRYSAFYKEGI